MDRPGISNITEVLAMTLDGVRKVGIIGSGIIAITTLALKTEPNIKIYFATVCITAIVLWGSGIQGWLDSKKAK